MQYASCLAKFLTNPISGLIQNSIPNFKPGLALYSQKMMRATTQENNFGLCDTQIVLLKGVL